MNKQISLYFYSALYAVFYTFCLYKNLHGITFPVFIAGTIFFAFEIFKVYSIKIKKDSIFYIVTSLLLGVSQFLTANLFIHFFNLIFSFILLLCLFMNQFIADANMSLPKYLNNLIDTAVGAIANLFAPFKDFKKIKEANAEENQVSGNKSNIIKILITVLCVIPFLVIIILLLSSADAVFKNFTNKIFDIGKLIESGDIFGIPFCILMVFLLTYGLCTFLFKRPFNTQKVSNKEKSDPLIAITAGIMLDVVYLIFSFIQIIYLFIGNFALPAGMSYAEYAREGFFQLLFVCFINLVLTFLGSLMFKENKLLKVILTVMCFCTYIMVASSALRMILYIRYYYFTFYRLLVLWALIVISALMCGILINIWNHNFNIVKYSLIAFFSLYLVLSFSHLDFFVAHFNLKNNQVTENTFFLSEDAYHDMEYVNSLSYDAAPAVYAAHIDGPAFYEKMVYRAGREEMSPRQFNVSVYIAKKLAKE